MIRQPSNLYAAFEPWRRRLKGERLPIIHEHPECGFWQRKIMRGGVFVPVAIWLEQIIEDGELADDERMRCLVNGRESDPQAEWSHCASHPIAESDYRWLEARHKWARAYAPSDPFATPHKAVDPLALEPIF